MSGKNVRKDVYPIRKGLKASETDSVKNMIPQEVMQILQEHKYYSKKIEQLDITSFIKIYGKGITCDTKKKDRLREKYRDSYLANAQDLKKHSQYKRNIKHVISISYQPVIDRLVVMIAKDYINKQTHKTLMRLISIKEQLINDNKKSVTNNDRNIIDHDENLRIVNELINYYSN